MKYVVVEIQTDSEGAVGVLTYPFPTFPEASSKYHNVLSYAAVSGLPMHACALLRSDGATLASEYFAVEPEPEPEPEPEATV